MPVYIIRAGLNGPVKIGSSIDPRTRVVTLQCGHYETLTLIRVMEGGRAEELSLHAAFADLNIRSEWFSFSRAMLGDLGLRDLPIPEVMDPREAQRIAMKAVWADPDRRIDMMRFRGRKRAANPVPPAAPDQASAA